jgi:hypothetical protein
MGFILELKLKENNIDNLINNEITKENKIIPINSHRLSIYLVYYLQNTEKSKVLKARSIYGNSLYFFRVYL